MLLTGLYLMRTGEIEGNLVRLNEEARLPHVADLVARKLAGPEQSAVGDEDVAFHRGEYERLVRELEEASRTSALPEAPSARAALNDLLVRVRLRGRGEEPHRSPVRNAYRPSTKMAFLIRSSYHQPVGTCHDQERLGVSIKAFPITSVNRRSAHQRSCSSVKIAIGEGKISVEPTHATVLMDSALTTGGSDAGAC